MANSSTVTRPEGLCGRCNGQAMDQMGRPAKTGTSIEELRSRIERGRYEVKPERVARAMLRRGVTFQAPQPRARPG
jgi:hypothetical protein